MLNISVITEDDRTKIINIYNEIVLDNRSALLDELNTIFLSYLQ